MIAFGSEDAATGVVADAAVAVSATAEGVDAGVSVNAVAKTGAEKASALTAINRFFIPISSPSITHDRYWPLH